MILDVVGSERLLEDCTRRVETTRVVATEYIFTIEVDATKKYLKRKISIFTAKDTKNTYFASLVKMGGHLEESESARSVQAQGGMGCRTAAGVSP